MSPEIARRVLALYREIRPPARAGCDPTPHELRVLQLLAEGHTYRGAAAELGVSSSAIHLPMRKIYGKLHEHSRSEAAAKALRQRLAR